MRNIPSSVYIFIVDTNEYAGNFERELTAHCTGQVGECGVGNETAEAFRKQFPEEFKALDPLIEQQPDDHGVMRPASIHPTPGFWNDGMGSAWPDADWGAPKTIETYRKEIADYQAEHPGSLEEKDAESTMPGRNPSYQSVAMFFHEPVPERLLSFMVERVKTFVPKWGDPFQVLGCRFIHERIVAQETVIWSAP